MKILKIIIAAILLSISFSLICNAQTKIGIGLVSINFDNKPIIHFYKNLNDKKAIRTIEFFDDNSINSINIKNLETQKKWLKPEALWFYFPTFSFRCKSKTNGWYEVIVNNESGQTLWMRNEKFTELLTWEMFLKSKFVIERLPKYKQAIRKLPSNGSKKIKYVGTDCFEVKSMKGDWIKIFTSDFCKSGYGENEGTILQSGWIKWKSGNTLLIKYSFAD